MRRDGRPDLPRPHRQALFETSLRQLPPSADRRQPRPPDAASSRIDSPRDGAGNQVEDARGPAAAGGADVRRRARRSATRTATPGSTAASTEVAETVRPLSLGLIDLGVAKGDKVSILANTRPEWTYFDFAALSVGATVVPIYQTNSPEECQYVLENSDAKVVVVEDDEQLEKIREVRDQLPQLEHVVRMTGTSEDAISLRRPGRARRRPRRRRVGAALELGHAARTSAPSSTPRAPPGRRRAA